MLCLEMFKTIFVPYFPGIAIQVLKTPLTKSIGVVQNVPTGTCTIIMKAIYNFRHPPTIYSIILLF